MMEVCKDYVFEQYKVDGVGIWPCPFHGMWLTSGRVIRKDNGEDAWEEPNGTLGELDLPAIFIPNTELIPVLQEAFKKSGNPKTMDEYLKEYK